MGDVLELFLDEKLERKILNEETFNVKKEWIKYGKMWGMWCRNKIQKIPSKVK